MSQRRECVLHQEEEASIINYVMDTCSDRVTLALITLEASLSPMTGCLADTDALSSAFVLVSTTHGE